MSSKCRRLLQKAVKYLPRFRFPLQYQTNSSDCGLACFVSILKYMGINVSLGKIRRMAEFDRTGTTLANLIYLANQLKISAQA